MADDVSEVKTRFQGRVAIITGGGSGLGRLLAHRFAAEGASVVVADLRNASAVAAEISEAGGLSLARTTDVTSAADVKAMVEVARESFGPVDDLHGLRLSVPYLAGVGLQLAIRRGGLTPRWRTVCAYATATSFIASIVACSSSAGLR